VESRSQTKTEKIKRMELIKISLDNVCEGASYKKEVCVKPLRQ